MLKKEPKRSPFFKKVGKGIIFLASLELLGFVATYYGYRRLNHDQELRYWVSQNYYPVLDIYYKTGEILGKSKLREIDEVTWANRK